MLHEFKIKIPLATVEETIERLLIVGLVNVYYEVPFTVEKDANGYVSKKMKEDSVDLMVYVEEETAELPLPDAYFTLIEETLLINREDVTYKVIDSQGWDVTFEDIDLGNGWVIVYPTSRNDYPEKKLIFFDPQGAFGTGIHETTQDCLRTILNESFEGVRVLDLGTGSGILSIAAGLKGASEILAVDIEPVEREVYYHAQANGVSVIRAMQLDLLDPEATIGEERFDWVFINIGKDETKDLVEKYQLFKRASNFLISGIVEWSAEQTKSLFLENGFTLEHVVQTNEWVTLKFSKLRK